MILTNALLVLAAFVIMEVFANLAHRYVMHGFGWGWHRSHHETRAADAVWEKNDLYAIVFATVAIALFAYDGTEGGPLFWIALGMTGYGLAYALLHDVLVHRRIAIQWRPRWRYLNRLIEAHRVHHAVKVREGAVSFGFLYAGDPHALAHQLRRARTVRRERDLDTS